MDRGSMLRSVIAVRKAVINVDLGLSGPGRGAKWHSEWPEAKFERYLKPEPFRSGPKSSLHAI